jgi:hypothetical protein
LLQQAREAAQRAVDLDPSEPDGHIWLARIAAGLDYDWPEALRQYRLAVARGGRITPEETAGCVLFLLLPLRLLAEALAACDAAIAADPLAGMPPHDHLLASPSAGRCGTAAKPKSSGPGVRRRIVEPGRDRPVRPSRGRNSASVRLRWNAGSCNRAHP